MQNEDGPFRNTRSSTGSNNKSVEKNGRQDCNFTVSEDPFSTPQISAEKDKVTQQINSRPRTPSGHLMSNSVVNIRNYFIQNENAHDASPTLVKPKSSRTNATQLTGAKANPIKAKKGKSINSNQPPLPFKTVQPNQEVDEPDSSTNRDITNSQLTIKVNENRGDRTLREERLTSNDQHYQLSYMDNNTPDGQSANRELLSIFNDQNKRQLESERYDSLINQQHLAKSLNTHQEQSRISTSQVLCTPTSSDRQHLESVNAQGASWTDTMDEIGREVPQAPINTTQSGEAAHNQLTADPKVMDLQIVMEMFREIENDLNQFKDFKAEVGSEKVKSLVDQEQTNSRAISLLQDELHRQQEHNKVMSGTIQRMAQIMGEMDRKIIELERHKMKDSLILTGFPYIKDRQERQDQLLDFLKDTMKVNVKVQDTYYVGDGENKPLIMVFKSVQNRNEVFYNKTKLKDYTNTDDKPFYINELLPADLSEKRRKENAIFSRNKRNTANAIEMSFFRGNLHIQNQVYSSKVKVPEPKDFLALSQKDLQDVMATKITPGKTITEQSSSFTGYTARATSYQHIRKAYLRMKLALPQARHIMCGYCLDGAEKHYTEDGCDDGEFGGSRAILETMRELKLKNCVVFVVRFYGGERLGQKRFEFIKQAVRYAAEQDKGLEKATSKQTQVPLEEIKNPETRHNEDVKKHKYRFGINSDKTISAEVDPRFTYTDMVKGRKYNQNTDQTARKLSYNEAAAHK